MDVPIFCFICGSYSSNLSIFCTHFEDATYLCSMNVDVVPVTPTAAVIPKIIVFGVILLARVFRPESLCLVRLLVFAYLSEYASLDRSSPLVLG